MEEMTKWEKFGAWLFGILWPRLENDAAVLKARLEVTHKRMRELYWDGKAKELSEALIAGLIVELQEADPGNEYLAKVLEARGGTGLKAIDITAEQIDPRALAPPDSSSCVFAPMDPMGWCRTHGRQCLTPEEFMSRVAFGPEKAAGEEA